MSPESFAVPPSSVEPGLEPPLVLRQLLREAEAAAPEAPALWSATAALSYAELRSRVDDLSRILRAAGVVAGDLVAVAADRTVDSVVAILSAVDCGAAYVPLDLGYPDERLRMMLGDAAPMVVLGSAEGLQTLGRRLGAFPTLEHPAARSTARFGDSTDLAYVLFTSGSTGRPKGVAMPRRPLEHLIGWHRAHPRLGRPARTLQFAPLSFDVHFQEIFSTLACGGVLVLPEEEERRDPARLLGLMTQQRVERVFMPYVALQMLADAARDAVPAALRDVISAGEQLQVTPAVRSLFARLPDAELHNHYGPTESHVVTAHELRGDPAGWPVIPPIGLPLPHVRLALRDAEGRVLEGAAEGELLLGGDTLANGYLGRPELTAERFVDAAAGLPGRWYVTGDLVQRDADGVLQFLGRADQQLKVDGFRVEPGEIEVQLLALEGVRDAVVAAPTVPGLGQQLVAYVVPRDASLDERQAQALFGRLRESLRSTLPAHMVPVRFHRLDALPTTPSGKIDRRGLPVPSSATIDAAAGPATIVTAIWKDLLGLSDIDPAANLFDLGARSLLVLRFVSRAREAGLTNVSVTDVYRAPTVRDLVARLERGTGDAQPRGRARRGASAAGASGVAIVGMAVRAAGAPDVEAFWQRLVAGEEGIRHFAPHELDPSIGAELRARPNFVAARGVLEDAGRFDAAFFGITPREAVLLDPQQRLLLELAWNALEHAAIDPTRVDGRIGVYAGTANNSYIPALLREQPELVRQSGEFAAMLASEKDYAATRIAHRLDLRGPAVSVHTACSTGLVAVAQAWHALVSGQCDVALAGGATVIVPQEGGYLHVEGGMESADGHCRPFDAGATGTVFGSAGGMVALKRLEDAIADGDPIHAVIRGVGLNNDGAVKASFTAPSVQGQADAIREALDRAQTSARSVGYVEAHGTGTSLGDPIEVAALSQAWAADTSDRGFCTLGSLKSNFGHTIAAAGVLGLIKTALSLERELIPGTLHFERANEHIDFAGSPFRVSAKAQPWPRGSEPRRAAVSSFGVGGTNAHVVLEEAPQRQAGNDEPGRRWVLPLSARTPEALRARALALANWLDAAPRTPLQEVAATLMAGRRAFEHRLSVVARDAAEAGAQLRADRPAVAAVSEPRVVFVFPGQGAQHPGMARGLYDESTAFREALDRCLGHLERLMPDVPWRTWLIDADPADGAIAALLAQTQHAQPALFSMSWALAQWLGSLGIRPQALVGHSIGEYAAAACAGVFDLESALQAVVTRGRAMAACPTGSMLAVRSGVDRIAERLPAGVEVAGLNGPDLTVVAGPAELLAGLAERLQADSIQATPLKVSHAFHSASMEAALAPVRDAVAGLRRAAPQLPMYSCVSGRHLGADEAVDPDYWARQVRAPVRFSAAVQAELAMPGQTVFVEVGPGQALSALLRLHRDAGGRPPRVVPLLGPAHQPGDPVQQALQSLGLLWAHGVDLAWPVPASARRCALPGYPFKGEVHWFRRQAPTATAAAIPAAAPTASITASKPTAPMKIDRLPRLSQELVRILGDVSGVPTDELRPDANLTDQGLDSLSLTQATLEIERVFGVKLRLRRLMEDLSTITALAAFLDAELPADRFAPAAPPSEPAPAAAAPLEALPAVVGAPVAPAAAIAFPAPSMPVAVAGDAMVQLVQQQMQLMSQQLALLGARGAAAVSAPLPAVPAVSPVAPGVAASPVGSPASVAPPTSAAPAAAEPARNALIEKPFGAAARITLERRAQLSAAQEQWLRDFVARYNGRTGRSKTFSQRYRKVMADPRVVTGFNPMWKDLVYPIVVDRSNGARLWDLDGNEYIDLLSCFGANLLGYQPEALVQAMQRQLQAGIEVGPQHPMAAEVAELIAEFTGMERVAFCNTGSEAVMGAMRIARTVTGRKTIAIFTNSYHGIFDEVIVRGTKQLRSLSAAPGILASAVENVLVLDWASEESLRVLRERGSELAAIMTEPIQNKYPTVQPREFMHELRRIADASGCALIFDEVVTGFRVAPGGAQEFYGVRADIATYGKVIGGGLPFAAIGGGSRWLDALDGGHWQYGDDSYPEAGVTYFAGTFVRHPLALAAARASLLHLKQAGRGLYETLNARTQSLVDRLNAAFAVRGAPVRAVHCTSLWRLSWDDDQRFVSLFYYLARFHGLHLYEQFGHFVTEAMGEAETGRIFEVFTSVLDELMALGFITPRGGPARVAGPDDAGPDARPADRSPAPLTPGQTERWLAASFDEGARVALNESLVLELDGGPVDPSAVEAALSDVMRRHEAFAICFDADEPLQKLSAAPRCEVHRLDLRDQADAEGAFERFCATSSRHDFKLDEAPLGRVTLVAMPGGRSIVHLVVSHLVFDGWASTAFLQDLAVAYQARRAGRAPAWPAAESPRAFARAEQARWAGEAGRAAREHWLRVLAQPPALLSLGDLSPPPVRRFLGDTLKARFDGPLLASLRRAAARSKATLFQYLLGVVTELIHRRTGRDDFVVGVPYASQGLGRHASLIADGVLDLPVRLVRKPGQPFEAVVADVRNRLLDALEHPLVTQSGIARELGVTSVGNRPPLTGVYFNLNPRLDVRGFEPLQARVRESRKLGLLGEVIFNFYETADALTLDLHHSTEFFSRTRAQELVDALRSVLDEVAAGAAAGQPAPAPVGAAPMANAAAAPALSDRLTDRDRELLARFNDTAVEYESGLTLGALIDRMVRARPDAIAVRFEGRSVTYAELDRMAWALAAHLRSLGVGPGHLVGVCLDRSVELVAALVGVSYSGGAYVPLDPGYPRERIANMCEDARLKVIVSRAAERERAGAAFPPGVPCVAMDAAPLTEWAGVPRGQLIGGPDDPAYVIFTSGSTGRPKGAMNSHRGIVNRLQWMQQEYQLTADDRVMQKTPYSFDVSVWEFYWPLMTGATIVVARPDGHRDPEYLLQLIEDDRVSVMHFVPSMLRLFLESVSGPRCPSLRQVICSGEALPIAAVDRFFELFPRVGLGNLYGPTEAAVDVTCWNCRPDDPRRVVPIGWPIANTHMYILGSRLELLPVGEVGDLYIGGVQVGMGYVSRPDLTAERFIPDPFVPGGRMYKTGDLGRWLDDGVVEYLGRSDHQVKIRGFRIELGEIEAQIEKSPVVASAVVVATELEPGDMALVAYAVPRPGVVLDAEPIREGLRSTLPEFMVPRVILFLSSMPLLPNGKIDRSKLPRPQAAPAASPGGAAAGQAPRGEVETQVHAAMKEILRLAELGLDDDFFRRGGHSLLAARLTARLNKEFSLSLPLRTIFEAPTVAKLARAIEAARSGGAPRREPVARQERQETGPLTVMQERLRLVGRMNAGTVAYNTPSGHRLSGPLDLGRFRAALTRMVERQPSLRTCIVETGDGPVQQVIAPFEVELPFTDISHLPHAEREAEVQRLMYGIIDVPIAIDRAPLFRVALFKMAAEEHVFLFMTHHIIWDGWSFDLLYQEMADLYRAQLEGQPPKLPPPAVSYVDYAHWHRRWTDSDECRQQIEFWKKRYDGLQRPRPLPTDRPRRAGMSGVGAVEWIYVDKDLTERLRQVAVDNGATLNMLSMALYAAMLSQALGGNSMVIGVPVRGRLASEVESVMGFFNNLLAVPLTVNPKATVGDWVQVVKKEMLESFANQDVPFERLLEEPEFAANAHRSGLYQSLFSFQDARERVRQWGPLKHESVLVMQRGATEDVGVWLMEVPAGLEGGMIYNADIFDESTAKLIMARLQDLFVRVAENPAQPIWQLLGEPTEAAIAYADWVRQRTRTPDVEAPAPAAARRAAPQEPQTPLERELRALWARLLEVDPAEIGRDDHFGDVGGSSLLFMRAMLAMEKELRIQVQPQDLLSKTLAGIAAAASAAKETAAPTPTAANGDAAAPEDRPKAKRAGLSKIFAGKPGRA